MHKKSSHCRLRKQLRRAAALGLCVALVAAMLSISVFAQRTYQITDGDYMALHTTFSTDPDVVLDEAGFELGKNDTYTTAHADGINQIHISRQQAITIDRYGARAEVYSYGETVGQLLARLQIDVADTDKLSCDVQAKTFNGMKIVISSVRVEVVTYEQKVPFSTVLYENDQLKGDETKLVSDGRDGLSRFTAEVIYENGKEVSRQILSEEVLTAPINRVMLCSATNSTRVQDNANGEYDSFLQTTADVLADAQRSEEWSEALPDESSDDTAELDESWPAEDSSGSWEEDSEEDNTTDGDWQNSDTSSSGNTFTTASGETFTYSQKLSCSATGYSCEGYTGYTYTGTVARVGAVAVDPNVIPLGSRLYIVTDDGFCVYGFCTAEDTGSAVKGNVVDLYFNTFDECYALGRRACTVYILD